MQTIFCPHCGAKHPYNLAKPAFCSACGERLSSLQASVKKNQKIFENDDDDNQDDDESFFSNSDCVPKLRKGIEVTVEADTKYRTLDLGSLIDGKGEKTVEPIKKDSLSIDNH